MIRIKKILLLLRQACDCEGVLQTASWLSRILGAPISVIRDEKLEHSNEDVKRRFAKLGIPGFSFEIQETADPIRYCIERSRRVESSPSELVMVGAKAAAFGAESSLDADTVRLIEATRQPILLFPYGHEFQVPWKSILTPMSGEERDNQALSCSLGLANALHVPIDIIHVIDTAAPHRAGRSAVASFGDEAHHELEPMIEEFISEACPYCSRTDKRAIRHFEILDAASAEHLLQHPGISQAGMVAVEWKGRFITGHAAILKSLLRGLQVPVLLVRQSVPRELNLKAGHRLAG